jgi:hypothetical protein
MAANCQARLCTRHPQGSLRSQTTVDIFGENRLRGVMIFKILYRAGPAHIRCSMFVSMAIDRTYAKAGEFVLRTDEWDEFRSQFSNFVFEESGSEEPSSA